MYNKQIKSEKLKEIVFFLKQEKKAPQSIYVRVPLTISGAPVRLNTAKYRLGTVQNFNGERELIAMYAEFGPIPDIDGALRTRDDAMFPSIPKASYFFIKRLRSLRDYRFGDTYMVVDKKINLYLRRIFPAENIECVILRADHPDKTSYPDVIIHYEDIKMIFSMVGSYTPDRNQPRPEPPYETGV